MSTPPSPLAPPHPPPPSKAPYAVAFIMLVAIGSIFILAVLTLRPQSDPLVVMGVVFAAVAAAGPSIFAFLKSEETRLSVNSHLEEFKAMSLAFSEVKAELARVQGRVEGVSSEQARVQETLAKVVVEKQKLSVNVDKKEPGKI